MSSPLKSQSAPTQLLSRHCQRRDFREMTAPTAAVWRSCVQQGSFSRRCVRGTTNYKQPGQILPGSALDNHWHEFWVIKKSLLSLKRQLSIFSAGGICSFVPLAGSRQKGRLVPWRTRVHSPLPSVRPSPSSKSYTLSPPPTIPPTNCDAAPTFSTGPLLRACG